MLRIGSIVWGVRDVLRAVAFWSAALSYRPLREPSPDWAILVPEAGPGPQLAITVVSSEADDHQRHHLDLYADDSVLEIERLLRLGARRVDWRYPPGADYTVLADPDGNTFCVVEKRPTGAPASADESGSRVATIAGPTSPARSRRRPSSG
ncbi:MAG TPA: VOC family protein [Beijerinckiaceae bacterium]|nr:VOC family protein [Beijerinckiaceae bacterium]